MDKRNDHHQRVRRKFYWGGLLLVFLLAGCGPIVTENNLKDFGPAPELENEIWLNTDALLRLADLRGSVVLIDMWTYG